MCPKMTKTECLQIYSKNLCRYKDPTIGCDGSCNSILCDSTGASICCPLGQQSYCTCTNHQSFCHCG